MISRTTDISVPLGECERDAHVNDSGPTRPGPEVAAPVDGEVEFADAAQLVDDGPGEDDDVDPSVSAHATAHPHPVVTAAPTPKTTANPPNPTHIRRWTHYLFVRPAVVSFTAFVKKFSHKLYGFGAISSEFADAPGIPDVSGRRVEMGRGPVIVGVSATPTGRAGSGRTRPLLLFEPLSTAAILAQPQTPDGETHIAGAPSRSRLTDGSPGL